MRYKALNLCLILTLLAGVALTQIQVKPANAASPYPYESAECPFEVAPGDTIECGYVTVPENHNDPAGKKVRLAVAVLKADTPSSDAVIYLDGGPGGETLVNYGPYLGEYFGMFNDTRDVVIFDQRGTGFSTPSLNCPEFTEVTLEYLDNHLSDEEWNTLYNETSQACHDRIVNEEGATLAHYNTIQNASDVNAIRQALGYEQFNLYGISYGTRLALTVMRDYPEGVRTAIIDSAVPLQADFYIDYPANTSRVFDLLFETCAADPVCNESYPNLKEVALETAQRLNENPVIMQSIIYNEPVDDLLNGDYFFQLLFQSMYVTSLLPYIPQIIYDVSEGDTEFLGIIAGFFLEDTFSEGMNYVFNCNEEYAFTSVDAAVAAYEQFAPEYTPFISTDEFVIERNLVNFCAIWDAGTAPATENEPVVSDIPTLLMAGEFDPVTPPAYTQWVGETLENSVYVEVPGAGHGPSLDGGCPTDIAVNFIDTADAASLDISCVAMMPGVQFIGQ